MQPITERVSVHNRNITGRTFSGVTSVLRLNLWLDLPLNLFQAQSTVNEKMNAYTYPDYKYTVSKCAFVHEYSERDGDAGRPKPRQMQAVVEHMSVLAVAMSASGETGLY